MKNNVISHNGRSTPEHRELFGIVGNTEPGGAIVLGSRGMGKTRLVNAVLASVGSPIPVMRLYASPTLSIVPYGVLSPYLGSLAKTDDAVEVLREINKWLAAVKTGNRIPVVVVEDAQHLDAESGFVLSLLLENAALKLIAIGSGALDNESALARLSESSALSTIVVQPLDHEAVRTVAEELVGGRLSEGTVGIIRAASGGNPSFVRAYVASCLEQGILFTGLPLENLSGDKTSPWIVAKPLPEVDERLIDVVTEIHSLVSAEEQRTLELLALGGPLPSKILSACGCRYRRLLDAGEVRSSTDSMIRMSSELHEAVLRQIINSQRKMDLYVAWDEARHALNLSPTPTQVLWGIEIGATVDADQVILAVQQACASQNLELAWKLCTGSGLESLGERGSLLEVRVLMGIGRYHSARSLLAGIIEQTSSEEMLSQAFNDLFLIMSRPGMALDGQPAIEQLWERRARRIDDSSDQVGITTKLRTAKVLVKYWMAVNSSGGLRPSVTELETLLKAIENAPEARPIVLSMLSDLHSVEGRCETALELARQALEDLESSAWMDGSFHVKISFRIGWNLLFSGRYAEAKDYLDSYQGSSIQLIVHRQGTVALLRGLSDFLQGRRRSAVDQLAEAVMELRVNDPGQLLSLAMHLYGWVVGCTARGPAGRNNHHIDAQKLEHEKAAGALAGKPSEQRLFSRAVAAVLGTPLGTETVEDFPLMERELLFLRTGQLDHQLLQGNAGQLRLKNLLALHEGPRVELMSRLVLLREQETPESLENLGRDALRHNEFPIGIEAMTRAALGYLAAGEPRLCGSILRQLGRLIDEHDLTVDGQVARALALTELTAREKEIVELAQSGLNNSEIARTLTVSQRTVEGHLYRVFSKLGISERSELSVIGS